MSSLDAAATGPLQNIPTELTIDETLAELEAADTTASSEIYDLLILVDATASMSSYLRSLQTSLPKIIAISALTSCFARIGLLAYRDYSDDDLIEWSGWLDQSGSTNGADQPDLAKKAKTLAASGGGDYPEALKTGLAKAYQVMRPEAETLILVYADAPPHTTGTASPKLPYCNHSKETAALSKADAYGGFGPAFVDWVSACKTLRSGEKKAQVFCVLEPSLADREDVGYFNYLSTMTKGVCFYLTNSDPHTISRVTVEVLLSWMGVEKPGASEFLNASMSRYTSGANIKKIENESDPVAVTFFPSGRQRIGARDVKSNITRITLTTEVLKKHLPKKHAPVQDFAKRYTVDNVYKALVVNHLRRLIIDDVSAITLNPVFGSLWRAVCNDRTNEARIELITAFGLEVDRITDAGEKARMKAWLEESYDYSAEVLEIINKVPQDQRYPCVFLDPTLIFAQDLEGKELDEDVDANRAITDFRRDELLEIGRSCDYRILRRLGRVLTRLTYVNSREDLPAHISNTTDSEVSKIPMALATEANGRKFWKILLHIVLPGTMLSARPAALLAALSIRLGVTPLFQAAESEMLGWRNKWNDIEVPETWNTSCLSLLLDADEAHRSKIGKKEGTSTQSPSTSLLKKSDRALFERLVSYKMLEANLNTVLVAKVGWTPERTVMPIGPVVICRGCHYPRSVTIMGPKGKCGLCLATDWESAELKEKRTRERVTKDDDESTQGIWVECNVRTCRAQYVVYNPEALKVRPKCHNCRHPAITTGKHKSELVLTLECVECLNQVIYPKEYRPLHLTVYTCVACSDKRKTIVDVETTAKKISEENTVGWILYNGNKIKEPFSNRSLFYTISNAGTESFCEQVQVLPEKDYFITLHHMGKAIRNQSDLKAQLQSWINRRRTEAGTCSLCFSDMPKSDIRPACGRSGCHQGICKDCLVGWYGLNSPGRIINTAALHCPFCRRAPTAKTLSNYGMGIHAVSGLRSAVENSGEWIYVWCSGCGVAKQYVERVCAAGAPREVRRWICTDCQDWEDALIADEEREARELDEADTQARHAIQQRDRQAADARHHERAVDSWRKTRVRGKKCPGCQTLTEKTGGCDHIQCPVRDCGTHWCFHCGEASEEAAIYTHMSAAHGGYYAGEEYPDGDE